VAIAVAVLVGIGVAIQLLAVVGLAAMNSVFDRLHFVGPTLLGLLPIAIAIVLLEGASQLAVKAMLIWAILLGSGPVLSHATVRAARVRQFDGWFILDTERAERATTELHQPPGSQ
jgi:multisubunit Na+/H+ antiporter MnhG subunit